MQSYAIKRCASKSITRLELCWIYLRVATNWPNIKSTSSCMAFFCQLLIPVWTAKFWVFNSYWLYTKVKFCWASHVSCDIIIKQLTRSHIRIIVHDIYLIHLILFWNCLTPDWTSNSEVSGNIDFDSNVNNRRNSTKIIRIFIPEQEKTSNDNINFYLACKTRAKSHIQSDILCGYITSLE